MKASRRKFLTGMVVAPVALPLVVEAASSAPVKEVPPLKINRLPKMVYNEHHSELFNTKLWGDKLKREAVHDWAFLSGDRR